MAALGGYILSVTMTALLCTMVCELGKHCNSLPVIRLVCSALLMLVVLRPLAAFRGIDFTLDSVMDQFQGTDAVAQGKNTARNALAEIIKQETEAYILDKANTLGAELQVEVQVADGETPYPVSVVIAGPVSPYVRLRLEELILEELNIAKEQQNWIG